MMPNSHKNVSKLAVPFNFRVCSFFKGRMQQSMPAFVTTNGYWTLAQYWDCYRSELGKEERARDFRLEISAAASQRWKRRCLWGSKIKSRWNSKTQQNGWGRCTASNTITGCDGTVKTFISREGGGLTTQVRLITGETNRGRGGQDSGRKEGQIHADLSSISSIKMFPPFVNLFTQERLTIYLLVHNTTQRVS